LGGTRLGCRGTRSGQHRTVRWAPHHFLSARSSVHPSDRQAALGAPCLWGCARCTHIRSPSGVGCPMSLGVCTLYTHQIAKRRWVPHVSGGVHAVHTAQPGFKIVCMTSRSCMHAVLPLPAQLLPHLDRHSHIGGHMAHAQRLCLCQ
jgi:hypothetical protein